MKGRSIVWVTGFELTALEPTDDSERDIRPYTTILIQTQSLHWTSSFNPYFSKNSFQMISMADTERFSFTQHNLSISLTVFWVNKRQRFAHQKPLIHLVGRANCKYMLWLWAEYSTNIAGQKVNGKADRSICIIFWSVHEQGRRRPSRALERTS